MPFFSLLPFSGVKFSKDKKKKKLLLMTLKKCLLPKIEARSISLLCNLGLSQKTQGAGLFGSLTWPVSFQMHAFFPRS